MALITLVRESPLPPTEVWGRLTDWPRHGTAVPFTRVTVATPPPPGTGTRTGTRFVARTGVGRLGFDDPMEVVVWRPPTATTAGLCRLEKRGTFVTGWAEIEVHAHGGPGSRVVWREELRVRWLPSAFDGPLAGAGRVLFGRAVGRLLADA
ncbi:SRPBCC family protein [Streptomyces sp. NPDC091292]|uniref:SRPBCC family protein n=1 Tax=Streptomyces sp. NPDC091292 TaxID=3365991 RepID=UPI0037FD0CF5